jgi:nucleotidyltransferase/DNA polymerase involved in DNA repair
MPLPTRTILHVDLDAFFAAVEVREDPRLAGEPVIVGADPKGGKGRGVVAAASYEARTYGIHSAMPISRAYARCPRGVYLRPRMGLYADTSRRFMAILHHYTDLVEPLSIDEAFLDVTGSLGLFGDGETIARRIRADVRRKEELTVSVGVAPTKFVAKIASDLRKPDGLVVVRPEEVDAFLCELPLARLWGAGPKAVAHFRRLGVSTIGQLRLVPLDQLRAAFGEAGARHFADLARGIDSREVIPEHARKSLGHEVTFEWDVADRDRVEKSLLSLVDQVTHRLRSHCLAGRTVTVKLRTDDFATITRRESLPRAANTTETIWPVALRLLRKADRGGRKIRLIGVAVSHFCEATQLELFEPTQVRKERKLADAVDAVIARFGDGAITRGALLVQPRARRRLGQS